MKNIFFFIIFFLCTQRFLFCQKFIYEAPMIYEGGILKSTRVVVAFNKNVIDTDRGVKIVDPEIYPIRDESVKNLINSLEIKYGKSTIRKTIPNRI